MTTGLKTSVGEVVATTQKTATEFNDTCTTTLTALKSTSDEHSNTATQMTTAATTLTQNITASIQLVEAEVKSLRDKHQQQLDRLFNELSSQLTSVANDTKSTWVNTIGQMQGDLSDLNKQNHQKLQQQVVALDEQLGSELTKSLNTLGGQLATLSNKFVSDYTPLTEKLQRVVQMSKDLDTKRRDGGQW
jgi:DNA anti-recombination protein RmuC